MSRRILPPGTLIGGKYRLEEPVGSGGFSHVYRAMHLSMERPVAVKIFDPSERSHRDPDVRARRIARFEREARLVARLNHPYTVTTFDFGEEEDGKLYLVMEFIKGRTLKAELRQVRPLERERTLALFHQILGSLIEAHHVGVLHRDLKPANIMITENYRGDEIVKVLDFGIARLVSDVEQELSAAGRPLFLGTPRFAAPEQLMGQPVSFATDTFGVGALMWICLTGEFMQPKRKIEDCIADARSPKPFRLPARPVLPGPLAAFLEKAVAKEPGRRFQDAAEMLSALETISGRTAEDLPEVRPSPFGVDLDTLVDPNITDPEEEENYFLAAAERRSPPMLAKTRPLRKLQVKVPARPLVKLQPTVTAEPLELDKQALGARRSETSATALERERPAGRARRPVEVPWRWLGGSVLAVALVSLAWTYWPSSPSESPQQRRGEARVFVEASPKERRSPFSVAGVERVLDASSWRVEEVSESVVLQRFNYYPIVLRKEGQFIDVTVYETRDAQTLEDLVDAVSFPARVIVLGHIAVRLHPRDNYAEDPTDELIDLLSSYRELVLEEAQSP